MLSATLIGLKEIDVKEAIEKAGEWVINKVFTLLGPEDKMKKLGPGAFG